jgi:Fis family transcriptional regulator, factor for inversion stimulation protein
VKAQLENIVLEMYREGTRFEEAVREFQRVFILTVLRDKKGNQCRAADKLGMHRNTLRRTIRDLQLDLGPIREAARRRPPQGERLDSLKQRATIRMERGH